LDYDGTLIKFHKRPQKAEPDDELYSLLTGINSNDKNKLVIVSSRDRKTLESWFGKTGICLAAEHGAWIKEDGNVWKTKVSFDDKWKKEILGIFKSYVDRTPKTFIEEKDFSLVWHYRNADRDFALMRLEELKCDIISAVENLNLGIIDGDKLLEVKSMNTDKGKVSSILLNRANYDFILSIGDDVTDEDMFDAVPNFGYTIKVGKKNSKARYRIKSYKEVIELLKLFGDSK